MKASQLACGLVLTGMLVDPARAQDGDWSGPYVGGYVEAAYDETGFEDFGCWMACTKPSTQGLSIKAGLSLGYDQQIDDSFLIGLAADIGNGSQRRFVEGASINSSSNGVLAFDSNHDFEAGLRARAGLIQGNTLVYVTGGMTLAHGAITAEATGVPSYWRSHSVNFAARWNGTNTGMLLGGGIEHRFGPASARFEILHRRYKQISTCFANTDAPNPGMCWSDNNAIPPQINFTPEATSLRIGLNYRF